MVTVRYFAAAAEAAGTASETVAARTLGDLAAAVRQGRDARFAAVLDRCAHLVDGQRVDDPAAVLPEGATVDVLPPFAGG